VSLFRKPRSLMLAPKAGRSERRHFRPRLEALEDPFAPTQLTLSKHIRGIDLDLAPSKGEHR